MSEPSEAEQAALDILVLYADVKRPSDTQIELSEKRIDAAIRAAVQAEREACARVAFDVAKLFDAEFSYGDIIAAAIRARGDE